MLYGFCQKRASEKGTKTQAYKELKENETKVGIPSLQLELCTIML
jgi:hypothetical protein